MPRSLFRSIPHHNQYRNPLPQIQAFSSQLEPVADVFLSRVLSEDWVLTPHAEKALCGCLRKLWVRCATALIKAWANAWTTSRLHEGVKHSCILGSEADDCLDRYLCCDPLWTGVISNSFRSVELSWSRPMTKEGFAGLSKEWLLMTAIAFACYHSIKMNHMSEVLRSPESGNPYQAHVRLMHYARAHSVEIVSN